MTRREDQVGKRGQNLAASILASIGVNMVEKIGTPVKLIPVKCGARKNVYQVIYGEKVSGDHRGILNDGTSVLVETKTILDRNLRWSDLREHQPGRLLEHSVHGGLSLLVWVHESGEYVMVFPIKGFEKGKSISVQRAQEEHEKTLELIRSVENEYSREHMEHVS